MAIAVKHNGSAIDLTSLSTNVDAAPVATPRQSGFTLRNRFEGSLAVTLSASAVTGASSQVANNPIYIMEVPAHTLVKNINVYAVEGKTVPGHAFTYSGTSASLSANDQALNIGFVAQPVKKWATSSGTKTKTYDSLSASLTLGQILLTAATASLPKGSLTGSPLKAINAPSSNTSSATKGGFYAGLAQGASNVNDDGTYNYPRFFPHGGRIVMTLTGAVVDNDSKINAMSGVCSGTWEVQAECVMATNAPKYD
ncbi:MAG: hypothetical protein ACXABY_24930 [Candidatus Thorarchaeota archaeon]|jgi:hypothetical protein